MDFFYQGERIDYHSDIYLKLIHSGIEYSTILYEKMNKVDKDIKFIKISGLTNENNKKDYFTIGKVNDKQIKSFFLLNQIVDNFPSGAKSIENILKIKNLNFQILDFTEIPVNLEQWKLEYSKNIYKDFYNIKIDKFVKDKESNTYKLLIVENFEPNIPKWFIQDVALLFKQEELIGYLKVKYTTQDLLNKHDLDYEQNISYRKNITTIDYTKIKENYRNKGLGYVLYFHMAQHLNNKGIEFRESNNQTIKAERLWNGIQKNLQEYTEVKQIDDENYLCFLTIGQNCHLIFENNKPKIKKLGV